MITSGNRCGRGWSNSGGGIDTPALWEEFAQGLFYHAGDMDNPASYQALAQLIQELETQRPTRGNQAYYLAVSPNFFPEAIRQLGQAGLLQNPRKQRLVIEKPFGRTLANGAGTQPGGTGGVPRGASLSD
jgi:glucose-6-phosphate 1-dehydrogenase